MKDIPPNVWRTSLNGDDWNFRQIQNDEWPQCLCSELLREKTQAERNGSFPSELIYSWTHEDMRRASRLPHITLGIKIGGDIVESMKRAGLGKWEKPDWTPYISLRKKELWKRLPPKPPLDRTFWIALDWHSVYRNLGDQIEYAGTHLPAPSIMDGDGESEFVPFRIPWGWRDDEIKTAFAQWLKDNRPKGEKGVYEIGGQNISWSDDRPRIDEPPAMPKAKGGAGSYLRQVKKILKALAAWRLIQHYKGKNFDAFYHPGAAEYLGKTYEHPSEWTSARKTVQAALKQLPHIYAQAEDFALTKKK